MGRRDLTEDEENEIEEVLLSEIPLQFTINSLECDEWYDAMMTEMNFIIKNNT